MKLTANTSRCSGHLQSDKAIIHNFHFAYFSAFSALTLLVGLHKEHPASKN